MRNIKKLLTIDNQYWLMCMPALMILSYFIAIDRFKQDKKKKLLHKLHIVYAISMGVCIFIIFIIECVLREPSKFKLYLELYLGHMAFAFVGMYSIKIQEKAEKENDI